ncbi:MAG TPA: hypothetical protein VHL11_21505 [Phototrophicaceae bacterium]|jgi:hypothetical protein|nr:hypothetical protein [Phototrophicaceae bacterium]
MSGTEFFRLIVPTAMGLMGVTALMGVFRKRSGLWDAAEQAGLWLSLELGLVAVLFALLPYPLSYSFGITPETETAIWRLGSLLLVLYLIFHMFLVNEKRRRFRAQYPLVMRFLLVLSGIFLTMEFVNAIWWGSLGGYTWGVLWLVALCGIQLIAFVCYDRQTTLQNQFSTLSAFVGTPVGTSTGTYAAVPVSATAPASAAPGSVSNNSAGERVRGGERPGDPNRAPNRFPDHHAKGNRLNRNSYRYTDDGAVYSYRGSNSDATVRVHADLLKRGDPNKSDSNSKS